MSTAANTIPRDSTPRNSTPRIVATAPGIDELLQGLDRDTADALLREFLAEAALRQHLQRVHDSHYASDSPRPSTLFRIG